MTVDISKIRVGDTIHIKPMVVTSVDGNSVRAVGCYGSRLTDAYFFAEEIERYEPRPFVRGDKVTSRIGQKMTGVVVFEQDGWVWFEWGNSYQVLTNSTYLALVEDNT